MLPSNISDDEFYRLVSEAVKRLKSDIGVKRDKWIDGAEAMKYLRITSKTTLQKLRDTGAIRFSQPFPKHILYDIESLDKYLEKHANK